MQGRDQRCCFSQFSDGSKLFALLGPLNQLSYDCNTTGSATDDNKVIFKYVFFSWLSSIVPTLMVLICALASFPEQQMDE